MAAAIVLVGLLCAGMAQAQPAAGADTPVGADTADLRPELKEVLPQGQLMGKTRLTVWGFEVYDARLWAPAGFGANSYATQPLALELAYLRAFSASDIADRSLKEMRRTAAFSEAQAAKWKAEMLRVVPDVKKGDRILGVHRPGTGAVFWVNGKPHGEIRDAEFARLFFGIWLSPKTSEPKMRDTLLAGAGG
ncbi:MAG: chalcone isomerase family protein [Polaromonas sp.]